MNCALIVLSLLVLVCGSGAAPALSTSITYQGRLMSSGAPFTGTADLEFQLYDQLSGGNTVGSSISRNAWPVEDGLFQVELDFGAGTFDGTARYLEVRVDGTLLSPRQRIGAAPVAQYALEGNEGPQGPQGPAGPEGPEGASPFVLDAGSGEISYQANDTAFVFTPSNGGAVGLGYAGNVASGYASSVGGGGDPLVGANFATGAYATVSGGLGNGAAGESSVVGGGRGNAALGRFATVPGGFGNCAGGSFSWAGGSNAKVRPSSTPLSSACAGVPSSGDSDGDTGTFVWADNSGSDFVSTGDRQFLVRASGGVGINTNTPSAALHVVGDTPSSLFDGQVKIQGDETTGAADTGGVLTFLGHDGDIPRVWAAIRGVKKTSTVGETDSRIRFYVRSDFRGGMFEAMRIDGSDAIFNTAGSWSTFSDRRLKKDIRPLTGVLPRLLALEGVRFRYRDPERVLGADGQRMGFIAQQVERIFPEWVGKDTDGMKYITPTGFEALVVEALRELKAGGDARLAQLQNRIDEQTARLGEMEAIVERNRKLEARLAALERVVLGDHRLAGETP